MIDGYTAQKIKDFWLNHTGVHTCDGRCNKQTIYARNQELEKKNAALKSRIQELDIRRASAYLQIEKIEQREKVYREALEKIANMDYRGNRSTESILAWNALRTEALSTGSQGTAK